MRSSAAWCTSRHFRAPFTRKRFSFRLPCSKESSRCSSAPCRPGRASAAAAAGRVMGPQPPQPRGKPDWVRILEEDAAVDEEVAQLLEGTGGDPDKIRAKMQQKLASPIGGGAGESMFQGRTGSDVPPRIQFREVDVFDLWVWLELAVPPSERERELLAACVRSWFVVGKLGGYNSQNLQVYYSNSDDNSFLDYDASEAGSAFSSLMHECSEVEFKGSWARFHLDMGTADELAFDILLNMLTGFSAEVAGITQIFVGGEHERWAVPARDDEEDEAGGSGGRGEHGAAPKVGMNPMKLPQGLEEELALLEEVGEIYNQQQQQQPGGPMGSRLRGSSSSSSSSSSGGGGGGQQQQQKQGLRPAGMQPIQPLQRASSSSSSGGGGGGGGGRAWGAGISSRRPAAGGAAGSRTRLQQIQQQRQQRLEAGGAADGQMQQQQQQQGAGGGAVTGKGSRVGRSRSTEQ